MFSRLNHVLSKNQQDIQNNKGSELQSIFTWRHGGHIGVQNNETAAMLVFQTNPVNRWTLSYLFKN